MISRQFSKRCRCFKRFDQRKIRLYFVHAGLVLCMWDLWRIENSSDSTHFLREKPWERGWRPEFSECDVRDLMRIFGNFICFSVVKYVLDLQCCLHAGEVFVYFVIHKFSLSFHQVLCSIVAYRDARSFVLLFHLIITDVFGIFLGWSTPWNSYWWGCTEQFSKS